MLLLSNQAATGEWCQWPGGQGVFQAAGTFNGATVTLQFLAPDGTTAVAMGTDTTLTAAGGGQFTYPAGKIRAAISGGPPSGMYASADPIAVVR